MKKLYLLLLIILATTACDMIEYHPYDTNFDKLDKNINSLNIKKLKTHINSEDTLRFVWMGDTQRWYDETNEFVANVNTRSDIDFVLHGGDITDFGMKAEYIWINNMMKKLKVPYITIVGNHDLVGNGKNIYPAMYGPMNFSFIFKRTKFICLNTNALEFDYSTPVPDFQFIINETADTASNAYDKTIVAMHAEPEGSEFNNNVKDVFQYAIKLNKNLMFCLHAHAHRLAKTDFFNDGIIYYGCDDIESKSYMIFTLVGDEYSYEVIYY